MLHLLLLSCLAATPASARPALVHPTDSIGVQVQGGKTYLKHKVAKGDSFYAIAKRYGVSMDQIVAANPKVQGKLSIGQVVLVPRATTVLTAEPAKPKAVAEKPEKKADPAPVTVAESVPTSRAARFHSVGSGQTLSSIARKYHVSIADLRRWNNLQNDNLKLKQRLIVGEGAAVAAKPAAEEKPIPKVEAAKAEPKKEEARKEEPKKEERHEETRSEATVDAPRRSPGADAADDTTAGTEVAESLRKVTESGTAEIIEQSGESAKYLALHRTAPVGTILQVKNPQNSMTVFVRVIGKLPPTGANENVIIRISKRAAQKLSVVDQRFRVEVSYMP